MPGGRTMNSARKAALLLLFWVTTSPLRRCSPTITSLPEKKEARLEKKPLPNESIGFLEVYNRSTCQPKETMVSVTEEHPFLANHIMLPSCVALKRCTGCCSDDSLACVPSHSRELIMEVMASLFPHRYINQLAFEEHLECMCRSKSALFRSNSVGRSCAPCWDRKKHPDQHTCKCVCRHGAAHCEKRGLKFNESTCRCMRRPGRRRKHTP